MKRIIAISTLLILASLGQTRATVFVRELWDNITNGTSISAGTYPLQGQTSGTTTYGFGPSVIWNVNPADPVATNALQVNSGQDVYDDYDKVYPNLPAQWTVTGTLFLAQPNTNGWDSGTWATRLMNLSSWIHQNVNSTNYFSFRWVKRSFYYPVSGTNGYGEDDAGLGVGFASGNLSSSTFIGIGVTRSMKQYTYSGTGYTNLAGSTDIGDTPYITSGTLGQAGYPGHPGDSGGPYYVRAYAGDGSGLGVVNQCEGYIPSSGFPISTNTVYMWGGIMVGRIVTTTGGNTEIDVKNYSGSDSVAFSLDQTNNPTTGWDAVYNVSSTATLGYLLVWMYGNNHANPCQIDGIRMASTWGEVTGQESETPVILSANPNVTPSNSSNIYYQGTPLVFSNVANITTGGSALTNWYEWLYNSNATLGASAVGIGSNVFVMANPLVANSGYYSVAYSNNWENGSGTVVTSPPVYLTIVAASPPSIATQPQPAGRYLAPGVVSCTFNVGVQGTPPFTYHWYQITSGGVTNPLPTQTNITLTLSAPIQVGMAGSYFITVSNYLGGTNSLPAAFNVIVPTPGSYAAQVVSNVPWGYWRLDENYGTTNLHDYFGGHDGSLDATNSGLDGTNIFTWGVYQQQPAAQLPGFPANHVGIYVPHNTYQAHAQVPGLGNYASNMTWMCWAYVPDPGNANVLGEHAEILWNRDYSGTSQGASGYGNAFGLNLYAYVPSPGVTNFGQLGYRWGGPVENPSQQWAGYMFPAGLYAPSNNWFFMAVSWGAANSATVYVGSPTGPLTSATATLPSTFDSHYPGTAYTNVSTILLGRGGYPWSEGLINANDQTGVYLSDVAIFTNALSPNAIYQIYLAAANQLITYSNSAGNLVLSWPAGTLWSSTNVQGPYVIVNSATSPYTVPKTAPRQFYRAQK
jgi:hypothetical protein